MDETTLSISGMTCQGCVNSVTNALRRVSGVSDASVSLETASARVRYDATQTSESALKAAVERAGFEVG